MNGQSLIQTRLQKLIFFSSLCLGICTALVFLEDLNWILSFFAHFIVQYTLMSIALLILAVLAWDVRSIALNCITLSVNVSLIVIGLNYVEGDFENSVGALHSVKIFSANLQTQNQDYASLKKIIGENNPDVIVLLETNDRWINALKGFAETYPYQISEPREDNFGITVLSRLKLNNSKVRHFNETIPYIETTIGNETMKLGLVAIHALPPIGMEYKNLRDKQMRLLAVEIGKKTRPFVIIGDFNDTLWSSNFKKFLRISQTKMVGLILTGTWPTWSLPFRIQIDHALVKNVGVSDVRVHRTIGSDHYPISLSVSAERQKESLH